jgi:hypothetical protein
MKMRLRHPHFFRGDMYIYIYHNVLGWIKKRHRLGTSCMDHTPLFQTKATKTRQKRKGGPYGGKDGEENTSYPLVLSHLSPIAKGGKPSTAAKSQISRQFPSYIYIYIINKEIKQKYTPAPPN